MNFDTLDRRMRGFENSIDRKMPDGCYIVARLDGHRFTNLTKKEWKLERPFDIRFHNIMVEVLKHLMDCGFRIIYGYTQSDEISLLFHREDSTFARKERKLVSILAAEASVAFSFFANRRAVFDCRLSSLPDEEAVVDYFRWRQGDARRNSLSAHCYWLLRGRGIAADDAQKRIAGLSMNDRRELLAGAGVDYAALPAWQRNGVGAYFKEQEKMGYNPVAEEWVRCKRRALFLEENLPVADCYSFFIRDILERK